MTEEERLSAAKLKVIGIEKERKGVGELGERTLHAVLKNYIEPDENRQEIKIGKYFADISNEEGITEIQTRSFNKLAEKLKYFLEFSEVTIVYPVAGIKWLCWVDPETGETSEKRKSPKRGTACDVFRELIMLRTILKRPGLHLRFIFLELTEYRIKNGWANDGKRGSTRADRVPERILGELYVQDESEYYKLLPEKLPEEFTAKDFAKAARLGRMAASAGLKLLCDMNAIQQSGKQGRAYLYSRADK